MNRELQTRAMYLFERVGEPLFLGPRGANNNILYEIPNLSPIQQHASTTLRSQLAPGVSNRISGSSASASSSTMVSLSAVQTPDLTMVGQRCPKSVLFSYFLPNHREAANEVRRILMSEQNVENFISLASACRDSIMVNTDLWVLAFASACLTRRDMRGFRMPALFEILPGSFFNPQVIRQAQEQAAVPGQDRMVIEIPRYFTSETNNPEAPLAYYREDLGINSHHWHWHLIYTDQAPREGPGSRNRKGELFYYMHHSMLSRYDAERLCNGLPMTAPLDVTRRLEEGYFPKLTNSNSGRIWNGRQENTTLTMVGRDFQVGPNDIRQWSDRIAEAIDSGFVLGRNNERLPLTEETGIDILGDIIENGGTVSPNVQFYGNLHNMGHVLIGLSHDPENRHLEGFGVMGDTATAMRDPAFYRWHKYVDDIFARYKASLQPYTQQQLLWEGTQVTGVSVQSPNVDPNILSTHWTQSDIDLSRGMDFGRSAETGGAIWARATHLNHERFTYQISVTSNAAEQVRGTVRIFLAPRNNQRGERLSFRDQRMLFFELDRFSTNLQPGNNTITRNSQDSTLTIPWNETFRDLESLAQDARNITATQAVCGCGWPEHMLLPRGSATGCVFDLFVMVTNGAEDAVARNGTQTEAQRQGCKDAFVYCGILDELYPDRKAMGFPFDRNATVPNTSTPIATLEQFIPANSNMFTTQVTIRHSDRITLRGNGAPPGMGRIDAEGNVISTPAPSPSNSTGRPGRGPGGQAPGQGGQRPGNGQGGQRPGNGQGGQRPGQGGQRPGNGQGGQRPAQGGQRPGNGQGGQRPASVQNRGSNQPIVFGDDSPPPARRGSRRQRDFDESGRISPDYFAE